MLVYFQILVNIHLGTSNNIICAHLCVLSLHCFGWMLILESQCILVVGGGVPILRTLPNRWRLTNHQIYFIWSNGKELCKGYYLEHFATLIERNILKDSNYCFDSLAIRQSLRTTNTLSLGMGYPDYSVSIYECSLKIIRFTK